MKNANCNLQSTFFKYNIQFSYQKRKRSIASRKHFPICIERSNSRSLLTNSYSIDYSLQQSIPMTDDRVILKSFSLPLDFKTKNSDFLSLRQEQPDQMIPHNFPKRKQRGKELRFFRMLRKYAQDNRLIEEQKIKARLLQIQNETYAGIKPHLKLKPKEPVLKQRYSLNRQKKEQKLLQTVKIDLGKSLNTIKVNPLRRKM